MGTLIIYSVHRPVFHVLWNLLELLKVLPFFVHEAGGLSPFAQFKQKEILGHKYLHFTGKWRDWTPSKLELWCGSVLLYSWKQIEKLHCCSKLGFLRTEFRVRVFVIKKKKSFVNNICLLFLYTGCCYF